ncbi:INO80 complex subunit C-like [Musca domestica]|uniref:INO80 complex subunit C-like n=1 Tax=Musca domestica TaxID=7370 RepID=A0ABM3VLG1_MUSDO|nr:INO80 complex subunit C-like [Musca domestica]
MDGEEVPCKKSKSSTVSITPTKEDVASDDKEGKTKDVNITKTTSDASSPTTAVTAKRPKISCKNPKFSYIEPGGKKFVWKSLKQIVTQERSLPWPDDVVLYNSLNAPPSLKPAKKYSDISGLEAPYTDPQTKLHYHNAEEFRIIRTLPSDIIQGYLALRGATNIVG